MPQKEQQARATIDQLLEQAGWYLCDVNEANIHFHRGVAVREFPLQSGNGFADYLLYVDGSAAGIIEAKKEGHTLSGVETQADKYAQGLPAALPAWSRPLPFAYQSTGAETRFTNGLDPQPRARSVFAFHKPERLAAQLGSHPGQVRELFSFPETFLSRLQAMPSLIEVGLWPAQIKTITNLEKSLRENRHRALIQMATGSGKTFTAISFIYRLIKFAGARWVLFLVDHGNLGDQTLKEFQQYASPYNNFKFSEEYAVQGSANAARGQEPEAANLWAQVLDKFAGSKFGRTSVRREARSAMDGAKQYFDAYLIGLTATPNKQTFGFFHQNLVMEYPHEQAVADGVNVNYDVYRIKTRITEGGSRVEAGYYVEQQDRDKLAGQPIWTHVVRPPPVSG